MRSGAEDPHLIDVEMVEDPEVLPLARSRRARRVAMARDDGDPVDTVAARVRGPLARPRLVSSVAVLAIVALVGWGMNQAEERRDEDRLEALAGLPGYLDPIAEPLTIAWRSTAGRPVARTTASLLLELEAGSGGAPAALTAVDIDSGRQVWSRAVAGEACSPLARDAGPDLPAVSLVACLPRAVLGTPAVPVVTILDATTGRPVRSQTAQDAILAELVDGYVLLTTAGDDGSVSVRAWDPVTGEDAWAFTGAPHRPDALRMAADWTDDVRDGKVTFESGDVRLTFDVVTGRRRTAATLGPSDRATLDLPGGREARWGFDRLGRPKDVVIVDRDGGARFGAPGVPWLAPVRDGSAQDVVVVRRTADKHLLGLDAGSGRVRWDLANVPWLEASVQVGGVVVAVSPSTAVAVDVRTGLRLWDHGAARGSAAWDVLTDGRLVLVPTDDDAGGVVLTARRLQTGERAWGVPLPGDVLSLDEVDGQTVLVLTDAGLVALR